MNWVTFLNLNIEINEENTRNRDANTRLRSKTLVYRFSSGDSKHSKRVSIPPDETSL